MSARSSWRADSAIALWGALTFAALLASFMGFRPVRDALVLDKSPDEIPWLFFATFAIGFIVSPLWSAFLGKRQKRRVVPMAFHVFAACILTFALLVASPADPIGVGRAFYVWSSIFNIFVVSVFWSLLADLIGTDKAKALFGPISAGGTLGGLVGPALTKLLVGHIGVAGILVISAVWLEIAVIAIAMLRRAGEATASEPDAATPSTPFTGLGQLLRSPYLLGVVGYVLCTAIAATFLYLEQASIVKAAFEHLPKDAARVARTDYFATVDMWIAGITLVVQALIATRLLRWFGPGVVLCFLPLAQLAGTIALANSASLTVLATIMVVTRAATHGLTRPGRELLFTVVGREDKYHAKNAIDTIAYRFGDLVASWVHKGVLALSSLGIVIASVPLTLAWLALAITLGIGFRRRATRA